MMETEKWRNIALVLGISGALIVALSFAASDLTATILSCAGIVLCVISLSINLSDRVR